MSSYLREASLQHLFEVVEVALVTRAGLRALTPTEETEQALAQVAYTLNVHAQELRRRADLAESLRFGAGVG